MKKIILLILIALSLISCEIDTYDCYRFEVRTEITYSPYRTPYYDYYTYDRCNLSYYMAMDEAESQEYVFSYYNGGYYITERRTCRFW